MSVRLYRGIVGPYRPEEVGSRQQETLSGTNFTDCPYRALSYAPGAKGEVLVVDVPNDAGASVTEELWLTGPEKRLMVWGTFDRWLTAILPAKELRLAVRRKGIVGLSPPDKGELLKQVIERQLGAQSGVTFDTVPLEPVTLRDPKGTPDPPLIHSPLALGVVHRSEWLARGLKREPEDAA